MTAVVPLSPEMGRTQLSPTAPWQAVVGAYLGSEIESPATRRAYATSLEEAFLVFGVAALGDLTTADLVALRNHVTSRSRRTPEGRTTEGLLSPNTQARILAAVRSLLDELAAKLDGRLEDARRCLLAAAGADSDGDDGLWLHLGQPITDALLALQGAQGTAVQLHLLLNAPRELVEGGPRRRRGPSSSPDGAS